MKNMLLLLLTIPFAGGLLSFLLPKKDKSLSGVLALLASAVTLIVCWWIFLLRPLSVIIASKYLFFVDNLSAFITLFIGFFGLLIVIYSLGFMSNKTDLPRYYAYILWTIAASIGAVVSNNLILLLTFSKSTLGFCRNKL